MADLIRALAAQFFKPPPCPDLDLGWAGRLSGAESALRAAFAGAYWAGVRDGAVFSVLAVLAVIVLAFVVKFNPFKVPL